MRAKQHQLATLLVSWCLIHGALSALTTTPSNVIIAKGEDVNMECSTDAATGINWRFDGSVVVQDCTSSDTSRFSVSSPTTNDCFITGHANTVSGNQGPYHCSDGSTVQAEAVAILIDPTPTCAVVTSPPIRDQNVTLSCVVTYINKGDEAHVNPRAVMSASVSWESAAGTVHSSSSTELPDDVGETLQVDVVQVATGTEIPSYTCTASFTFTDRPSVDFMYALNELSWPCVSEPVRTWYCPTSATVTPFSGPFETGDVLKCEADGYPLFYTWTDSNGNVVSSTSSVTIFNPGDFTLTCSAAGNFTTPCEATSSVSGTATGDPITTVAPVTGTGINGNGGNGNGTNGNGGNGGNGTGTDGSALSAGAIAGIVAGLALLALLALILCIWICRRRKKEEGRPHSIAFYQAVRAGRPAKFGCRGKENPYWMMDAYRPRSIDHQVYGNFCGPGNCYSPRYSQQSVPMSPVFH